MAYDHNIVALFFFKAFVYVTKSEKSYFGQARIFFYLVSKFHIAEKKTLKGAKNNQFIGDGSSLFF